MKKNTNTKKTSAKNAVPRGVTVRTAERIQSDSNWSLSIYIYWFIIILFIAATFLIMGISMGKNKCKAKVETTVIEQQVTEEPVKAEQQIAEESLKQAPDYYADAKLALNAGDIEIAIMDLDTVIETKPEMVDAYILRGEVYMQIGDYEKSMADFNKALEIDAKNSVAYYDRSLLNTRLLDYDAAMIDINNALATFASNPNEILQMRDLYAKRGQLNLWLKNWEGAVSDYTNALARDEGKISATFYADRAEAYMNLGEFAKAAEDYASAIRVINEQAQATTTEEQKEDMSVQAMGYLEKIAGLHINMGNLVAAREELEQASQIALLIGDTETEERLKKWLQEL